MLVLLAAALAVAACGKGGSQVATVVTVTVPAGASTTPGGGAGGAEGGGSKAGGGGPGGSVARGGASEAQRRAYAKAVNVTEAELPGFHVAPRPKATESPSEKKAGTELARCAGGSGEGLGEMGSEQFQRKVSLVSFSVASGVSFTATPAEAKAELERLRSPRSRACIERYAATVFGRSSFHGLVGRPRVSSGSPPAPGTSGGFAWRIVAPVSVAGTQVPIYIDILGFVYGTSQVTLISSGFPTPLPAQAEEQLYTGLIQRAVAHGG